jgi:excisionase family DNA binding protein
MSPSELLTFKGVGMPRDIFTLREVAHYLKVTERTIYRLVAEHRIPAFKVGGSWRFRQADLDRWMRNQMYLGEQAPGSERSPSAGSRAAGARR